MRRRRRKDPEGARQKAQYLIDLALDESTSVDERRTAAMQAVKHIDKYDMLSRPFEGNETVQAAMNVAETITDSDLVGNLKKLVGQIGQARRRR
jgi:hypothetical protein